MVNSEPTIHTLKTSFLRTQISTLSTPLRPSTGFITAQEDADHVLRQKHIDDALLKLNVQLKKHNKLVYGALATRHVAEQVDKLYWNAGERGIDIGVVGEGEEWLRRSCDMADETIITQLPDKWSEAALTRAPEKAAQFTALQSRLVELNKRRKLMKEKVERYKAMKELLGPFEDVDGDVQENVVVKNGELERELERMKLLLLRVERGVGELPEKERSGDEDGEEMDFDWEREEEERLVAVVDGD